MAFLFKEKKKKEDLILITKYLVTIASAKLP